MWRAVIQLNIVRSIRIILDTLDSGLSPTVSPQASPRSRIRSLSNRNAGRPSDHAPFSAELAGPSHANGNGNGEYYYDEVFDETSDTELQYSPVHLPSSSPLDAIRQRLAPLQQIEKVLIAKLVPPNEDEPTRLGIPPHIPSEAMVNSRVQNKNQEVFVRPGPGLKGALSRARVHYPSFHNDSSDEDTDITYGRPNSAGNTGLETPDDTQAVLNTLRREMIQLWADAHVRQVLRHKKIRLEEQPGLLVLQSSLLRATHWFTAFSMI